MTDKKAKAYAVDPSKVFIVTPTHDGNVCCGYAGALARSAGLYGAIGFISGNSNIALARALQAAAFLAREEFTWLLSIDADMQWTRKDLELLYEGEEPIVCAEYAKKDGSNRPAQLGLGFTRIHRDVFGHLRTLTTDRTPDGKEAPMIGNFKWESQIVDDFFPTGPGMDGRFLGEDQGFFHLVQMSGLLPRIETRTRLLHWGRAAFAYEPPASNSELPTMPA